MPGPIRIAVLADTKDIKPAMAGVEAAVTDAAATAERAGARIDGAFDGTAEHADNVASKGAQAAGAFSGLGSLAAESGGKVGALGNAMMVTGIATQAAADAGDLLNVVTESTIVKTTLSKAAQLANAVATRASAGAAKVAAAAQWALNAAMSANPIALVVIALVALVAGLVIAYKKSETFRRIVNGAFGKVQAVAGRFAGFFTRTIPHAVSSVVDFVKRRWPLILAIMAGPLGLVVLAVTRNVDKIKSGFSHLVDFIRGIPGRIRDLVGRFADAGSALASGLVNGIRHIGGSVGDIGRDIANSVIDFLNGALPHTLSINKGPIHVSVPLFPTIPHLADGGITTGPMLALIGDNPGGREAVIPLDKYPLGGPREVKIYLTPTPTTSPYDQGEAVADALRAYFDGGGRL